MDRLTIRQLWYSWPSLVGLCGLASFIVLGFVVGPGAFGVAAIVALGWVISKFATKIEVTQRDVGLSTWLLRRKSAPRDAIYSVHRYGQAFTFVDEGGQALLMVRGLGWTRGQLLDVSEKLGVPLYTHRTKNGLGTDAQEGQLMQRASHDEVSGGSRPSASR